MASPDRFDGLEVDQHQARFAGTVELEPQDADTMSMDTQFMAVVVCTVSGATVTDNAKGEVVRTNKFKLDNFAVVRDQELRDTLYEKLGSLTGVEAPAEMFKPAADRPAETVPEENVAEELPEDDVVVVTSVDEDEEVFSPGNARRHESARVPTGLPAPGSRPRQYDPALAAFLNE